MISNDYGHNAQAGYINPLYKEAMESFEAYLVIRHLSIKKPIQTQFNIK